MKLLIVLVNYNGSSLTIDCLRSLEGELAALPEAHIVVCDNGSADTELARLEQAIADWPYRDRVTLRKISPNQGFTGGNNVVIREACESLDPPDLVFLLNNDTLVEPGSVERLVNFLEENPSAGLCGSRLVYPDGESQRAARRTIGVLSELEAYARLGVVSKLLRPWLVAPQDESDQPRTCGWLPGASLMIRREVIEKVGLLDEDLYTYFDDVDYCLRARRAGWSTWYVPESRIVHLVGRTTGITDHSQRPKRRPEYWFWARRHYFLKNFGPLYAVLADLAAASGLIIWKARNFIGRRPDCDPPHLLGDLLRHSVLATGFRIRPVINPLTGARVLTSSMKSSPTQVV